jgi:hypothetical protein
MSRQREHRIALGIFMVHRDVFFAASARLATPLCPRVSCAY